MKKDKFRELIDLKLILKLRGGSQRGRSELSGQWLLFIIVTAIMVSWMCAYVEKRESESRQSCPTLCNPMTYTVHEILQARVLDWVAFPFFSRSSQPRDRTQVSHIAGRFFTS